MEQGSRFSTRRAGDQTRSSTEDAVDELRAAFAREPELIQAMLVGIDDTPADQQQLILTAVGQAADAHPKQADSHYFAARAAVTCQDWQQAGTCVGRALDINPKYNDARILAAKIEQAQGRRDQAIAHLECALNNEADYADVHLLLGDLLRETGDADGARHAYDRARQLNPHLVAAHERLNQLTTGITEVDGA
ncbi:MAG: tetratricopeptide repeat protein [Phycisphaerae bacterium]|nr:tetratricopeptide repeat protein [Phycisphaerae bacterium]